MKKKVPVEVNKPNTTYSDEDQVKLEVMQHYSWWTDDNQTRKTRPDIGWDEITKAYYGRLPDDWPFISRTTDPRIRTTLLEKNARLTNRPMRGKVAPREGGDIIKARINNALINYQWDAANYGGSMTSKIGITDLDSRLYQSKFGYVYWREVKDDKQTIFSGNEFMPLNIEDCGMDPNAEGIKDAKWFQMRSYDLVSNLAANADLYPGLEELKKRISMDKSKKEVTQTRRDSNYLNANKQLKGLQDRMGTDLAFPVVEKVVEFRSDKQIVFCPKYGVVLGVLNNPYDHKKIPIVQLRYYPTTGDNLGESEVASVLPLWKAIQAVLCAFLDEVILKMRPPLKGIEGSFRMETIVYAPTAIWLMDNINALTEVETRADSVRYFQTTYPALVGAFNTAMGDLSQGISNIDATKADKTATEVRQVSRQQNIRDQKNQLDLGEFVKDIVMLWMSNNRQFLFKDPSQHKYVLRIIGQENYEYFKRLGMDEMVLTPEATKYIEDMVTKLQQSGQQVSPSTIQTMADAAKIPKYPIANNPNADNIKDMDIQPKMMVSEMGDSAELNIVPEDLDGLYDFIPDTKSMEMSQSEQVMFARTQAIQTTTNPNVLQLLQLEGWKPKIKDLLVADYEDKGLNDAQRFFEQIQPGAGSQPQSPQPGFDPTGGALPAQQAGGMGNTPQAPSQSSIEQQMARPNGL